MENIREFAEKLSNLTVLECYQLAKIMEQEYGIKPTANVASVPSIETKEVEKVIEKTQFDVIIKSAGTTNKLGVIKSIKEMTGMSLLEIKNLVDNSPAKLKENVSKDEALTLENTLKALGAEIEVL